MSRAEYQHLVEQIERSLRTLAKQSAMDESMKKSSVTFSKKDLLNELMEEDEEEVMSRRSSERCRRPARSPGRRSSPRGQVQYGTAEGEGLGVNPQTRQAQLPDKLPTRPTPKEQQETHGSKLRKPRDRPFIDTKPACLLRPSGTPWATVFFPSPPLSLQLTKTAPA